MTSKSMNEVEVSQTETGSTRVHQFHDEDSQEYDVVLAREQVPLGRQLNPLARATRSA